MRRFKPAAAFLAALAVLPLVGIFFVGWWLDYSQQPRKADVIVVLGGQEVSRPLYGAELFREGYAPEVWVSRVRVRESLRMVREIGIPVLGEDEIAVEVLKRKGVPAGRIRRYGSGAVSTVHEGLMLGAELEPEKKRVLVVTSRYHARRSRFILRGVLKGREVTVVASPYESFSRRWWRDQDMAKAAVLEAVKTCYYFLGGRFVAHP